MKNEYKIIKIGGAAVGADLGTGRDEEIEKICGNEKEKIREFSLLVDFLNDLPINQNHIIVISAFGRTTRLLKNASAAAVADLDEGLQSLAESLSIFYEIIRQNNSQQAKQIELIINRLHDELAELLKSVNKTQELTARTLDRIMSYGERASSELLHSYLSRRRHCSMLRSRDFMITNDKYGNAKPLRDEIKSRLKKFLESKRPKLVITEGFTGITQSGVITTMGFESSNLTTAIICEALGAKSMQIVTNVPGIRTADPKLFSNTKLIEKMSYEAALKASMSGLKLLHEESIRIAERNSTEISYTNLSSDEETIVSNGGTSAVPLFIFNSEDNSITILNFSAERLLSAISKTMTDANYELTLKTTSENVKNKAKIRSVDKEYLKLYQALHDAIVHNS